MKFNFLVFTILFLLFCNLTFAETPNIKIEISEDVEHCEVCREHSMDGWSITFRLINLSDKAVLVTGVGFRDSDDESDNYKYFFPNEFGQTFNNVTCKWSYDGKNTKPSWVENVDFSTSDFIKISPMGSYEFNTRIGWSFESRHFSRKIFLVSFEDKTKLYEIESPAYYLMRNNTTDFGKAIIEENPCKQN